MLLQSMRDFLARDRKAACEGSFVPYASTPQARRPNIAPKIHGSRSLGVAGLGVKEYSEYF